MTICILEEFKYSLDIYFQAKVFDGTNAGFLFHSGGSEMLDIQFDPYGAILYGYTETEVYIWKPDKSNTNGFLVYVGGKWGGGQNNQQVTTAEVTVKVSSLDGVSRSLLYYFCLFDVGGFWFHSMFFLLIWRRLHYD